MEIVKLDKSVTCKKCNISDFRYLSFGEEYKKLCISCLYNILKQLVGEVE